MELIVVDAGVLIGVLNADDVHHDAARAALRSARDHGATFVVPVSAYAEVLVAPLRQRPSAADEVDAFLDALPVTIEPATREIARGAALLRARHGGRLRLPDALVIATASVLNAVRVLTTDAGWPEVDVSVEVIVPGDR